MLLRWDDPHQFRSFDRIDLTGLVVKKRSVWAAFTSNIVIVDEFAQYRLQNKCVISRLLP